MTTEEEAQVILGWLFRCCPTKLQRVLEAFQGSAASVLEKQAVIPDTLMSTGMKKWLREHCLHAAVSRIQEATARQGIRFIFRHSSEFPSLLKEIPDPPLVLYAKGAPLQEHCIKLAFVGARLSSSYGITWSKKQASVLSRQGITIVSGLARGIDTAALQGALDGGGTAIAVLGSGLGHIYPPENKKLFQAIQSRGTVLSELPPNEPPLAVNFPVRNRIISGLCVGVCVVEAGPKSGSLITARMALEQNRQVFAVPGRPCDSKSAGCNRLIQDGAYLVQNAPEIQTLLGVPVQSGASLPDTVPSLDAPFMDVLSHIGYDPVHPDLIKERLPRWSDSRFALTLVQLEMGSYIRRLPGNYFVRSEKTVAN